jgi:hypothetical protein
VGGSVLFVLVYNPPKKSVSDVYDNDCAPAGAAKGHMSVVMAATAGINIKLMRLNRDTRGINLRLDISPSFPQQRRLLRRLFCAVRSEAGRPNTTQNKNGSRIHLALLVHVHDEP